MGILIGSTYEINTKNSRDPVALEKLATVLEYNTNLTILDLSHNKIRDEGLRQ